MPQQFDLIVIGSGSAGNTCAHACRAAGWSVAVIDSHPFGGTCAQRGCDPKKVLVGAAQLVDWSQRFQSLGITDRLRIDWPALMRFKKTFTDPVPAQREQAFKDAGITAILGRARFSDRASITVNDETLTARHFVIAAGARPQPLGIPGEEHLSLSDDFLDLPQLPTEIVFVGGGYISFEFAHLSNRAGAKVTILHRGPRPLAGFEGELVDALVESSRRRGIDIVLEAAVESIEKRGGRVIVHARQGDTMRSCEGDLVVHGAGRVPDIADLDTDTAGIATGRRGVTVNEYLQSTTNPAVYAAGDAADGGGMPLTPVAGLEGEIVADNLLHSNRRRADLEPVASAVYSIPTVAKVGLTEAEAQKRGLRFHVESGDMSAWYENRRLAAAPARFKTLIDNDTGRIIGAHVLGPHAEEQINALTLAMRAGFTAKDIRSVLFTYPTGASDLEYMVT